MYDGKIVVVGMGPVGSVISALLLAQGHDVALVGRPNPHLQAIRENSLTLRGVFDLHVRPEKVFSSVTELAGHPMDLTFITVKTPGLKPLVQELAQLHSSTSRYVSAQNGLDTEKVLADRFGPRSAFRMVLTMGSTIVEPGVVETTFFLPPHHLGCLDEKSREEAMEIARMLTEAGLETDYTDKIQTMVWKKTIMKAALAPICVLADTTLKGCVEHPVVKHVTEGGLKESIEVARAAGIDLPPDYLRQCLDFNRRAGHHKDSMCADVKQKRPTEIDFLNLKIIEYARRYDILTPILLTTSSLIKSLEESYLKGQE
jgi:2-dehydropantoate 2-reductase